MLVLALKLLMAPLLIAAVSLAGRRWGPGVSGWLIGFPLTSGPVSIILALQEGPHFAAQAGVGNLGGMASICMFCLIYTLMARWYSWHMCVLGGALAFFFVTALWNAFSPALGLTCGLVLLVEILTIRLIPAQPGWRPAAQLPRWDLPARMGIATAFVLLITTIASLLGAHLSGLVTPFPVFGTVLATFAHRQQGPEAAAHVWHGLLVSLFGYGSFFLVVSSLLLHLGLLWTYLFASLAALLVNGLTLRVVR